MKKSWRQSLVKSKFSCRCGRTLKECVEGDSKGMLVCAWKCGYFVLPKDRKRLIKNGTLKKAS